METKIINDNSKPVLTFDQALCKTIPKNSKGFYQQMTFGMAFQIITFFMYMISSLSTYPILGGMAFLEKDPAHLQCRDNSTEKMVNNGTWSWKPCTQDHVCQHKLAKD